MHLTLAVKPPITLPRGQLQRLSFRPKQYVFDGSVRYFQFSSGFICRKCTNPGISITKVSGPPASNSKIFHCGFSDKRAAKAQPAVPAPTTIKSYACRRVTSLSIYSKDRLFWPSCKNCKNDNKILPSPSVNSRTDAIMQQRFPSTSLTGDDHTALKQIRIRFVLTGPIPPIRSVLLNKSDKLDSLDFLLRRLPIRFGTTLPLE
uniref:Uncharacterized protein n=1 Tax=Glossina palpalis gambiensis TaxID=67801 RepID=A0A1B0BFS1_9MUSC